MSNIENKHEEIIDLVRKNNKILKGLQSRVRWQTLFSVIKWVVILAIVAGAYYYLEPYLVSLMETYQSLQEGVSSLKNISPPNLPDIPDFSGFFNN